MDLGTLFEIALLDPEQWQSKAIKALYADRPNKTVNKSTGKEYGFTQKDNKAWLEQKKALAEEMADQGFFFVEEDDFVFLSDLVDQVKKHPVVRPILEMAPIKNETVVFEWLDWEWIGVLDARGQIILDVKYTTTKSTVEKVARQFFSMNYFIPAFIYNQGLRRKLQKDLPVIYMTFDSTGSVFPFEVPSEVLQFGERKTQYYVNELERCIRQDAWSMGPEFFGLPGENSKFIPLTLPAYLSNG